MQLNAFMEYLDEIAFPIWTPDGQLEWHELVVVVRECLSSSWDHFLQDQLPPHWLSLSGISLAGEKSTDMKSVRDGVIKAQV